MSHWAPESSPLPQRGAGWGGGLQARGSQTWEGKGLLALEQASQASAFPPLVCSFVSIPGNSFHIYLPIFPAHDVELCPFLSLHLLLSPLPPLPVLCRLGLHC